MAKSGRDGTGEKETAFDAIRMVSNYSGNAPMHPPFPARYENLLAAVQSNVSRLNVGCLCHVSIQHLHENPRISSQGHPREIWSSCASRGSRADSRRV